MVLPSQSPFDESIKGGDVTFREIPVETDPRTLIDTHRSESFDHRGIQADPNLAFPLDRLRELVQERHIGSLNDRHWSCMGSITAPGRLVRDTAPAVAASMAVDAVDVALLVPV